MTAFVAQSQHGSCLSLVPQVRTPASDEQASLSVCRTPIGQPAFKARGSLLIWFDKDTHGL